MPDNASSRAATAATLAAEPQAGVAIGTISGTVRDVTGAPLSGAEVKLTRDRNTPARQTITAQDGSYFFTNTAPGPFELSIAHSGFKSKTVSATLPDTEGYFAPAITLELAAVVTEVDVHLTSEEIAQ